MLNTYYQSIRIAGKNPFNDGVGGVSVADGWLVGACSAVASAAY
jgi:hypothetical protein